MTRESTDAIVLSRTDYGEADRILTLITSDQGKIKLIAKGVRRSKAKLAGSVEPFGVTAVSFVFGRGEIKTLTSARLVTNYGNIVKSLERSSVAYELMRLTDRATEDKAERGYFDILDTGLASLNDINMSAELTDLWFKMQLLKLSGHTPNISADENGKKLAKSKSYTFEHDKMRFEPDEKGKFNENQIKFLRLGFGNHSPKALSRIAGIDELVDSSRGLVDTILKTYIRY